MLLATAGQDIKATDPVLSNVHITGGVGVQPLYSATFNAGRSIELQKVETLGDVQISATNGSIKLNAPIGPAYQDPPDCSSCGLYNFGQGYFRDDYVQWSNQNQGLGVASLILSAPAGAIDMAGARARGAVDVTFGSGLTSSREIIGGLALHYPQGAAAPVLSNTPIGVQDQILTRLPVGGSTIAPGPLLSGVQSANGLVALAPIIPSIPILTTNVVPFVPGGQIVGSPAPPGPSHAATETSNGADTLEPIIPNVPEVLFSGVIGGSVNGEETTKVASESATSGALEPSANPGVVLVFAGGRGLAQAADFGRSGMIGSITDVFLATQTDENEQRRKSRK